MTFFVVQNIVDKNCSCFNSIDLSIDALKATAGLQINLFFFRALTARDIIKPQNTCS